MSHFAVLVITDMEPADGVLSRVLQPWHEFECTGIEDEYVRDVDLTEEAKTAYAVGDHEEDESLVDWVSGYYGKEIVPFGESPDRGGIHKYGYIRVDAAGGLLELVNRTNPDAQWDWWTVGGRWPEMLRTMTHLSGVDCCQASDLNLPLMLSANQRKRREWLDEIRDNCGLPEDHLEKGLQLKEVSHAQWLTLSEPKPRGPDHTKWVRDNFGEAGEYLATIQEKGQSFELPNVQLGQTLAQWVEAALPLQVFSVVRDGQWLERGKMGWWGLVTNEKKLDDWGSSLGQILAELKPDQWLTIVDCHI